ncbi:PREDICTED: uncharacterized protein LOC106814843 [Priapulus caudatus]|uniref:Uncharacterized protein LOC106814843 n=1 Tax=Priapulus caudatus TaxID=37621 RepID=A0ABM1ER70_PRICU|nr:PREDICTED: uncharacterized protein LOC106814843 [Priapulus caudatus]
MAVRLSASLSLRCLQLAPLMSRLDLMRFPLGVVYGSRDPLVEANISHEVGRLLGVEEWEEVARRGDTPLEDGAELSEGQRYIRGLRIAGGSHFCFKDQLDNVTSMILDLLVHTTKNAAKAARS